LRHRQGISIRNKARNPGDVPGPIRRPPVLRGLNPMRIDILTLFPEMFEGVLGSSMLGLARTKGLASYHLHNWRDHAEGFHRKVDDRPFGGGPGMVLKPEPIFRCLESLLGGQSVSSWPPLIMLSPQGERFSQDMAKELSTCHQIVLLAGHYEGFDERVRQGLPIREISLGDYVLTGGELPALVLVDSIVRLLPGVLGDAESALRESFLDGLLDHPHYTRPEEFRGMSVPEVLRSGDHAAIAAWRRREARKRTDERRPDLDASGRPDCEDDKG